MKITKRQLKKIIREEYQKVLKETNLRKRLKSPVRRNLRELILSEADTDVYEGDHDPIRIEIPALEKIAPEENFEGEKVWFSDSLASEIAEMLEDGPPDTSEIEYDEDARKKSEFWDKLEAALGDGWYDEEREKLAKNIRDEIQNAEDLGYTS